VELGLGSPCDPMGCGCLQTDKVCPQCIGQSERKKEPWHAVEGERTPGLRNENGAECRLPSPLGARIVRLREAALVNDFG